MARKKTVWVLIVYRMDEDTASGAATCREREECEFSQRMLAEREACRLQREDPAVRFDLMIDTDFNGRRLRLVTDPDAGAPFTARPPAAGRFARAASS